MGGLCAMGEGQLRAPPARFGFCLPDLSTFSFYSVSFQQPENALNALGVTSRLPSLYRRRIIYVWLWIYTFGSVVWGGFVVLGFFFALFFFFIVIIGNSNWFTPREASCSPARSLPSCKTLLAPGCWCSLLLFFRFKRDL